MTVRHKEIVINFILLSISVFFLLAVAPMERFSRLFFFPFIVRVDFIVKDLQKPIII
jgi:hypothetical protein